MKVLAVNIRSGGNVAALDRLLERCFTHAPDTIVCSEYRNNAVGKVLCRKLEEGGFGQRCASPSTRNGVLIASRHSFAGTVNPFGLRDDEYPDAIVEAVFPLYRLFGVYLPGQDRKRVHLRLLIATAKRYNEQYIAAMCIGDFNSGRNDRDIEANRGGSRHVDEFSTAGLYATLECEWSEAWLYHHPDGREFSWYPFRNVPLEKPRKNGWRIDKAFVSPALLPAVRRADYDHTFRTDLLTDHSAIVVEIDSTPHRPPAQ